MIVIVMGVVGAGKTTIGRLLAEQLGWQFADADDFHPPSNVEKMRNGRPLTDDDRRPWLDRLRREIGQWIVAGRNVVRFAYLKGSTALIAERLRSRRGHFANEQILASQFADLEEPEEAVTVDISATPRQIVTEIRQKLALA